MKKILLVIGICLLGIGLVSADSHSSTPEQLTAQELVDGEWNMIAGGEDTICSRGTDYSFFVRPGDSEKLMIHFQGGGACWNGVTCSEGPLQTFDDAVRDGEVEVYQAGLFDAENPDNPVGEYTQIVVAYCTGDIHVGDATVNYGDLVIEHNGARNADAVLDWVYENYPDPSDVFVNGCSAGAYGAIFHAPNIAAQYSDANVNHFGDAGVGTTTPDWDGLATWGMFDVIGEYFPTLDGQTQETFDINMLYAEAAKAYPDVFFSQYTTEEDETQMAFYGLMGADAATWPALAQEKLRALDELDNFASFTAAGELHCIIPFPEFYEYETGGVALFDWVAAIASGDGAETAALE